MVGNIYVPYFPPARQLSKVLSQTSFDMPNSSRSGACQGRSEKEPLGRRKREPIEQMVSGIFGGERALERSGRGLSPPKRVRRGRFIGQWVGSFCGGFV